MRAVFWSYLFLMINFVAVKIILALKRGASSRNQAEPPGVSSTIPDDWTGIEKGGSLSAVSILEWEYEYIRNTASEAMQDRHTMVNFYLVLVGVVASGVLANLDKLKDWEGGATLLLWCVCSVGWFHFLILVRLREAWHDSMLALLQLREFCVKHDVHFPPDVLRQAFYWKKETLPSADKPWSVFFYSALMIALLDSLAFGIGGHLLSVGSKTVSLATSILLVALSAALFAFHIHAYFAFLRKPK